jgi:predicted alpha/beta-hydrolase family hydrolase
LLATNAPTTVVLAHGAGAGMDTSFMDLFAQGSADGGLRVVRFEFPYMAQRRRGGSKRPPDREDVLCEAWLEIILLTMVVGSSAWAVAGDDSPIRLSNSHLTLRFDRRSGAWIGFADAHGGENLGP